MLLDNIKSKRLPVVEISPHCSIAIMPIYILTAPSLEQFVQSLTIPPRNKSKGSPVHAKWVNNATMIRHLQLETLHTVGGSWSWTRRT